MPADVTATRAPDASKGPERTRAPRFTMGVIVLVAAAVLGLFLWKVWPVARSNTFLGVGDGRRYLIWDSALVFSLGVIGLLARTAVRRALSLAVTGLVVAWVLAIIAISGNIGSFVAAIATLASSWAVGRWTLRLLLRREHLEPLVEFSLGSGIVAVVVQILGRSGLLSWWAALVLIGVPCATWPRHLKRPKRRLLTSVQALGDTRVSFCVYVVLAVLAGWEAVWSSAPEIQYDALSAKAWLPQHWAHLGRITTMAQHPQTVLTGSAEILAYPADLLHAFSAGRYLQYGIVLVMAASLWRWGARWNVMAGPIGAFIAGTTPMLIWQASTAYDDAFLAMWALALAIGAYELGSQNDGGVRVGLALGGLGGVCIGGKLNLAAFAVALPVLWCFWSPSRRMFVRRALGIIGGFLITGVAGYAYTWAAVGNPVFPAYNNVFRSSFYPAINEKLNFPYLHQGGIESLMKVPWTMLVNPSRLTEALPAGAFGLLEVALLAAIVIGWRSSQPSRLIWGALLVAVAAWWIEFRYLRYLIPEAIVAIALLVPVLFELSLPRDQPGRRLRPGLDRRLAAMATLAAPALFIPTLASFWNVPARVPLAVVTGHQSQNAYLTAALSYFPDLQEFNQDAGRHAVLLADPDVPARTLLRPDLDLTATYELETQFSLHHVASNAEAIYRAMVRRHVTWALFPAQGSSPGSEVGYWAPVLEAHGSLVYAASDWYLIHLVSTPKVGWTPVAAYCGRRGAVATNCWGSVRPSSVGSLWTDPSGTPLVRTVQTCPGASYRLRARNRGAGVSRVAVTFPGVGWDYNYLDVKSTSKEDLYVTVPRGARLMTIAAEPGGPASDVPDIQLSVGTGSC